MSRSLWKGPFSEILQSLTRESSALSKPFSEKDLKKKVWSRRSMILPAYVGRKVLVYNGRIFIPLSISEEMIGHKFGEFALTRKKPKHKINKKKQVARRKKK